MLTNFFVLLLFFATINRKKNCHFVFVVTKNNSVLQLRSSLEFKLVFKLSNFALFLPHPESREYFLLALLKAALENTNDI